LSRPMEIDANDRQKALKAIVIAALIAGILCLHYLTFPEKRYYHAVYRMLFYLPLVLGSLWFGMKGAIYVCVSVSLLFLPHAVMKWEGFSITDLHRLSEGALYICIGLTLGYLVEKQRKRQETLVRIRSLAAIGRAVSEIAHDMKTPLMAIGGFTRQVLKRLEPDSPDGNKLGLVIRETAHLESMVRKMLDFGRPIELRLEEEDLNKLVSDSVETAQQVAGKTGVKVEADPAPSIPPVVLDSARVRQVVLNLITNAIQASTEGDRVVVRISLNTPMVVLEVVDHGLGIAEEDRDSIFEPFFSTKRGGTGLGLGIVKKIVEAHGGSVSFSINRDKGVTFTVRLPLRAEMYRVSDNDFGKARGRNRSKSYP